MQEPPKLQRLDPEKVENWLRSGQFIRSEDKVDRLFRHLINYEKYLQHVEGVLKEQTDTVVQLTGQLSAANQKLAAYANDLAEASAECRIPVPEPGTDMARVVVSNMVLHRQLELVLTETARRENERS